MMRLHACVSEAEEKAAAGEKSSESSVSSTLSGIVSTRWPRHVGVHSLHAMKNLLRKVPCHGILRYNRCVNDMWMYSVASLHNGMSDARRADSVQRGALPVSRVYDSIESARDGE